MNDIILNNSSAENVAGRDININEIPKIISIKDAILTENDKTLQKEVINFLRTQFELVARFSDIVHLPINHFVEDIREVVIPPKNFDEELNPYKEYQIGLNVLPVLALDNEAWYFFQNKNFIFFDKPPYAIILKALNRESDWGYVDGYKPNNTILDIDMLKKVLEQISKRIEMFDMDLTKKRTQYSHAFFNVVMIEIERLQAKCQKLLDETSLFIEKHQNPTMPSPQDDSAQVNKHTRTTRTITMKELDDISKGGLSQFDTMLFSTTDNMKEILQAFLLDFSSENKG
jgi:hypothetical protein|nr:MAG TPA: hypothetical protein [Caudoviricetes sp.]